MIGSGTHAVDSNLDEAPDPSPCCASSERLPPWCCCRRRSSAGRQKLEIEPRFTIDPPCFFICSTAYFVTMAVPIMFTPSERCHSSTVASKPLRINVAASLTRISIPPKCLTASSEIFLASASREMSASTKCSNTTLLPEWRERFPRRLWDQCPQPPPWRLPQPEPPPWRGRFPRRLPLQSQLCLLLSH